MDGTFQRVKITHKVDYGVRVVAAIAQAETANPGRPVTRTALSERNDVPPGFLFDILRQLRNAEILRSVRGGDGGWLLGRPADEITVADVIRALDGPLASVRGVRPHELLEEGGHEPFISMWIAVRAALRSILENITVADLASGNLPDDVALLAARPDSWDPHRPPR